MIIDFLREKQCFRRSGTGEGTDWGKRIAAGEDRHHREREGSECQHEDSQTMETRGAGKFPPRQRAWPLHRLKSAAVSVA